MVGDFGETVVIDWGLAKDLSGAIADPSTDPAAMKQGRVLGGGVAVKSHTLALILKPDFQQVRYTAWVKHAINRRFQHPAKGNREEIAKLEQKELIELKLSNRYKDNVSRYLKVIQALPLKETPGQRVDRVAQLERQLLDPVTSATAALRRFFSASRSTSVSWVTGVVRR